MLVNRAVLVASALTLAAVLPLPALAEGWQGLSAAPAAGQMPLMPATAPAATAPAAILAPAPAPMVMPQAVAPAPAAMPQAANAMPQIVFQPQQPAGVVPFDPAAQASPAVAAPAAPEPVDETALRYYASQRDTARVAAEIRRIRLRHPDWVPPTDLFDKAQKSTVDLTEVWALFGAGRYDEVRMRLENLKQRDPAFVPPQELMQKLDAAQARVFLIQASESKDHARVIAIARNFPSMLGCGDVDAMWRVAESLAASGDMERSYSAYDYILATCSNPQERLATVQKAGQALPPVVVTRLLQRGQVRIDGTTEFDPVLVDLARSEVGKAIGASYGAGADPASLQRVEIAARMHRAAGDINLLGWYYYSRKEYDKAAEWFAIAAADGDAKAIVGLALAKREGGDPEAAMTIVNESRDRSPELSKIWVEFVSARLTSPDGGELPAATDLADLEEVVDAQKSALGAQSIGWWLYNQGEFEPALGWFEKSVAWEESEEGVLGLGLTARRLGDKARVAEVLDRYKTRYASLAALGNKTGDVRVTADAGPVRVKTRSSKPAQVSDEMVEEAVALYEGKRYREALDVLEEIERKGGKDPNLAMLKGWSLYKVKDFKGAKEVFAEVDQTKSTTDSRRALFYADKATRHRIYQ
jgi:tetratricopeptide (TPR) repeat protein